MKLIGKLRTTNAGIAIPQRLHNYIKEYCALEGQMRIIDGEAL
ncbi:MAG: hypothetical protein ACX93T_02180 [Bacteroidota bacterium]